MFLSVTTAETVLGIDSPLKPPAMASRIPISKATFAAGNSSGHSRSESTKQMDKDHGAAPITRKALPGDAGQGRHRALWAGIGDLTADKPPTSE
jgi:hypothetical protein